MASKPIAPEEIARRILVIEACLREGYAPPNVGGGRGAALGAAAKRLNINHGTLHESIACGRMKPDWTLYRPPESARVTSGFPEPTPVPPPTKPRFRVKADGTVRNDQGHPVDHKGDLLPLADRQRIALEDQIKALRAELKTVHRSELAADSIRSQIYGLANAPPQPPAWLTEKKVGGSAPGVPMTIWSDWHWGEVVRPEEVAGVNEFNSEIARARLRKLVDRTIDLCFNHMVNPDYPGIVVCLGGDVCAGEIHPELTETNDQRILPALLDVQGELITALGRIADRFGRVFVPCVIGNHGRNTLKPRAKARAFTSYEWHLYNQLERHFQGDDRFSFLIPQEMDAHFSVYGHRYMLTHGDSLGVRGGDGIIGSLGPIMRGRIKTHTSEVQIGRDFDTLLIGHWHNYMALQGLIVNGCLVGYDEFARNFLRARYQPPTQALWFSNPRHGITCHWPIYLDDSRQARSDEWLTWRAAA